MRHRSGWNRSALLGFISLAASIGGAAGACGGSEFTSGTGATGSGAGTTSSSSGAGGAGGDTATATATSTTGTGQGGAGGAGGSGTGGMPCVDADGDGVTDCNGDCDDLDVTVFPGATEVCGDAKDNDCANGVDDICQGLGTYVSSDNGSDNNPGTQAQPVQTIAKGIANAQQIGFGVDVYVAAGHYPEGVMLVEGISLLGGYEDMTWTRDPIANDTAILVPNFAGVFAPGSITRQTLLDGFRIQGASGSPPNPPGSAAISVAGSPTISNNRIFGGNIVGGAAWNTQASVGIYVAGAIAAPGPLVSGNSMAGGDSVDRSIGLLIDSPGPTVVEVSGNDIRGGGGLRSNGIADWSSGPGTLFANNDISVGKANAGDAWGIAIQGAATIDKNRINADLAVVGSCTNTQEWCGGIVSFSSSTTITNNVVLGVAGARTAAVRLIEAEQAAGVVILNGNYLQGAQPNAPANLSTAIALRNGFSGNNTVIGRVRNNILRPGSATTRYGVYEEQNPNDATKTVRLEALENNDFDVVVGGSEFFYRQYTVVQPISLSTMAAVNLLIGSANNFEGNCNPDATYHLAGVLCIDAGIATEAPADDFDGDARGQGLGVDVGPDEAQ